MTRVFQTVLLLLSIAGGFSDEIQAQLASQHDDLNEPFVAMNKFLSYASWLFTRFFLVCLGVS